jgi:Fe-S-cluster containining protein
VSFPLHEVDTRPGGWVPAAYTESLGDGSACMRGTRNHPRRCIALSGTIGVDVRCVIYARRPSPCRIFAPEAEWGHGDAACGDARRLHWLPPLAGSYEGFPIA